MSSAEAEVRGSKGGKALMNWIQFFHGISAVVRTTLGRHPAISVRMAQQLFCCAVVVVCVCPIGSAVAATSSDRAHFQNQLGIRPQHETVLKLSPRTLQHARAGRNRLQLSPIQRQGATALLSVRAAPMFACNAAVCACRGDADCNDMFTTDLCGPSAECDEDTNTCICLRR
jgi:hypothetical protein